MVYIYMMQIPKYVLRSIAWMYNDPYNKVHGANVGPTWVLLAPGGPHVVPLNLAIRGTLMMPPAACTARLAAAMPVALWNK